MAADGFDVRPEALRAASTTLHDDVQRMRLAADTAANALLAAVAGSGVGPLGATLDQVLDEISRALVAASAECAAHADRVLATASGYEAGDTSSADAIRRALSPDDATRA